MKKLLRNKKAFSSVFSGFFCLMLFIAGVNIYMWQVNQYSQFQNAVDSMLELDMAAQSENLKFEYPVVSNLVINSGISEFNLLVTNTESHEVEIARLYIYNCITNSLTILDERIGASAYGFNSGYIGGGEQNHTIPVRTDVNIHDGDIYSFELVTKKGRVFSAHYPTQELETEFIYIGPAVFNFEYDSFNFTTTEGDSYWAEHSRPAWEMVSDLDDVMFWIKISNVSNRTIEIHHLTYMETIIPLGKQGSLILEEEWYFFIVDPASKSNNVIPYSWYDQAIPPGATAIVKFGATQPSGSALRTMPDPPPENPDESKFLYTNYIIIYWRWLETEQYYGQVVPFTTMHVITGEYNFIYGGGVAKWAWGIGTSSFPTGNISPNEMAYTLTNNDYSDLAENDGSRYLNPAPGVGNYSTLIANFTVAKGYWDIDRVAVTWNGRGETSSTDVEMYIWDFNAADWQLLDSGSGSSDFTLQWFTTSNPEDYIDTSNTLTVMIRSQDQDRSTLHDWIEVDIDYE